MKASQGPIRDPNHPCYEDARIGMSVPTMTDTVASVLAEMQASVVSSAFPEARLWADRIVAAHEREVGEYKNRCEEAQQILQSAGPWVQIVEDAIKVLGDPPNV